MIEKVIQAIAEPRRREIMSLIQSRELTTNEISSHFDISTPAISQHLQVLANSGLVQVRKAGNKRFYQIRKEGFSELRQYINSFWDDRLSLLKEAAEEEERSKYDK